MTLHGIQIPDSKLAGNHRTGRDTESALLFHHSSRVYYFGAFAGKHSGLRFDPELLYAERCSMTWAYPTVQQRQERFEVDGANAAASSCRPTGSVKRMSIRFGRRSRCTLRQDTAAHASRGRVTHGRCRDGCTRLGFQEFSEAERKSDPCTSAR